MSLIYTTHGHRLYVGGKKDARNRERLRELQITHILNVTPAKEVSVVAGVPNYFEKEFTYLRIPVYDASTSVLDFQKSADKIIKFIAVGLVHGNVLVHCQMGASRSVTAAIMYLMQRAGMTLETALDLIQRRRPSAQPIPEFMEMLRKLEASCCSLKDAASQTKSAAVSSSATSTPEKKVYTRLPEKKRTIGPSMPTSNSDAPEAAIIRSRTVIGPTWPGAPSTAVDVSTAGRADNVSSEEHQHQHKRQKKVASQNISLEESKTLAIGVEINDNIKDNGNDNIKEDDQGNDSI